MIQIILSQIYEYQGTDWLAELASEWEQEAKNCGDGVRVVILRYSFLITPAACPLSSCIEEGFSGSLHNRLGVVLPLLPLAKIQSLFFIG